MKEFDKWWKDGDKGIRSEYFEGKAWKAAFKYIERQGVRLVDGSSFNEEDDEYYEIDAHVFDKELRGSNQSLDQDSVKNPWEN